MESTHTANIISLAADLAAKADEIEHVLVIYQKKGAGCASMDNNIRVETAVCLCEMFKAWIIHCMTRD